MTDISIMFVIGSIVMIAFCIAMLSCAKITGNKKKYYTRAAIVGSLYTISALLHFIKL